MAAPVCEQSRLEPAYYANIDNHEGLRQQIVADLASYLSADVTLSMWCFAQHYSAVADEQPFNTTSASKFGYEEPREPLYYFGILVWRKPPGLEEPRSIGYWAEFALVNDGLTVVDEDGSVLETVVEGVTIDPRICAGVQFEPELFKRVRSNEELGVLVEEAIHAVVAATGVLRTPMPATRKKEDIR